MKTLHQYLDNVNIFCPKPTSKEWKPANICTTKKTIPKSEAYLEGMKTDYYQ